VSAGAQDGITNAAPWDHLTPSIRDALVMPAVPAPDAPLADVAGVVA
jgi:hypothetical protein